MANLIKLRSTCSILLLFELISLLMVASESEIEPLYDPVETDANRRLFEGDIIGIDLESVALSANPSKDIGQNGVTDLSLRWPNGVVYYQLSVTFENDLNRKNLILEAMKGFDRTCIKFKRRTAESVNYVKIVAGFGCSSFIGKTGGAQQVSYNIAGAACAYSLDSKATQSCLYDVPSISLINGLLSGCLKDKGIIQHELMHALGFYHEQARTDRDKYVEINYSNIAEDDKVQFFKYDNTTAFGEPYDFGSVMHYGKFDFALDPTVWTIRPKAPYTDMEIGQRRGLSDTDIKKINSMYKCPGFPESGSIIEPVFGTPHRGCYFVDTRTGEARFTTDEVDPDLCTYIIVTNGDISSEGSLMVDERSDKDIFTKLNYKDSYPNLKVLISVAGKHGTSLSDIINDRSTRSRFISSAISNLRRWGIDGVDINLDQKLSAVLLTAFLEELRAAFDQESRQTKKQRLAISVAIKFSPTIAKFAGSDLEKYIDIANIAAYDLGNTPNDRTSASHHSPLFLGPIGAPSRYNMKSLLEHWSASGISKSKIVAGIPFYGRGWLLKNTDARYLGAAAEARIPASAFTKEIGIWPFYEICQRIKSEKASNVFDADIGASYAFTEAWWIGYNDKETVKLKTKWVRDNNYGGVYVWDISQDDFKDSCGGGENPLLKAIRNVSI